MTSSKYQNVLEENDKHIRYISLEDATPVITSSRSCSGEESGDGGASED